MRALLLIACLGSVHGVRLSKDSDFSREKETSKEMGVTRAVIDGEVFTDSKAVLEKMEHVFNEKHSVPGLPRLKLNQDLFGMQFENTPTNLMDAKKELNRTVMNYLTQRFGSEEEIEKNAHMLKQMESRAAAKQESKDTAMENSLLSKKDGKGWNVVSIGSVMEKKKNHDGSEEKHAPYVYKRNEALNELVGKPHHMYPVDSNYDPMDFGKWQAKDMMFLKMYIQLIHMDFFVNKLLCGCPLYWSLWASNLQVAYVNAGETAYQECEKSDYGEKAKSIDRVWMQRTKGTFNERLNWKDQRRMMPFKLAYVLGMAREETNKAYYHDPKNLNYKPKEKYSFMDQLYSTPLYQDTFEFTRLLAPSSDYDAKS